jgi:hypothetical protein
MENHVIDVLMVGITVLFFAVALGYTAACNHL